MKCKQQIILSGRASQTIFDLPCITAIYKDVEGTVYELAEVSDRDSGRRQSAAFKGDILCEDTEGNWEIIRKINRFMKNELLRKYKQLRGIDWGKDLSSQEVRAVVDALHDMFIGPITDITTKDVADFRTQMKNMKRYVEF